MIAGRISEEIDGRVADMKQQCRAMKGLGHNGHPVSSIVRTGTRSPNAMVITPQPHQPRQQRELRHLLHGRRTAALGSVNADGTAMVSMVPYAIEASAPCLVIHVSSLAAHTANLLHQPAVSLLVTAPEMTGEPVHALPRATLQGKAQAPAPDSPDWHTARAAYLARFPEAGAMMELGDFRLVRIHIDQIRQIAGFGAARTVDAREIAQLFAAQHN